MAGTCRVLHVDDDEDISVIVRLSLSLDSGMVVRSADSGPAALDLLRGEDRWRPDLLLIDYKMPKMTGADFLAALRSIPDCASLPVIFLTAKADTASRDNLLELGAIGVIVKPFDPMVLAHRVRGMLSGSRDSA